MFNFNDPLKLRTFNVTVGPDSPLLMWNMFLQEVASDLSSDHVLNKAQRDFNSWFTYSCFSFLLCKTALKLKLGSSPFFHPSVSWDVAVFSHSRPFL